MLNNNMKQLRNNKKPIVISITGLPGSGKTFLCNKLLSLKKNGVICVDTDDLVEKNISFKKVLAKHKNALVIVFSGITMKIPKSKIKYMIKINPSVTYKRLLRREFTSMFKHQNQILKTIKQNTNANKLKMDIIRVSKINWFVPDYQDFRKEYATLSAKEKKLGTKLKTISEIFSDIKKLL